MTEVNKNRAKTDEAWERLYARLDKDRLLVEAGQGRAVRRKLLLKWGTLAACRNCRFCLSGICFMVRAGR